MRAPHVEPRLHALRRKGGWGVRIWLLIIGSPRPVAVMRQETVMPGKSVKIRATEGGEFDCYLVTPAGGDTVPAVVLACSIDGVDADLRQIADEFAAAGYVAAAPDLFWRTVPGPLASGDTRAHERSQPRLEKITTNERDMVDTLAFLRKLPQCNGRAATMGFCYGGALPHFRAEGVWFRARVPWP